MSVFYQKPRQYNVKYGFMITYRIGGDFKYCILKIEVFHQGNKMRFYSRSLALHPIRNKNLKDDRSKRLN